MKISSIETTFLDYPKHTAMIVFMTGCVHNCRNCHNPQLQDPKFGSDITLDEIVVEYKKRPLCKAIVFSGGDPLFQKESLIEYCKELSKIAKIGVYTGYSVSAVPEELLKYISFLKTEPYIEELGGLESPKTNQKCWDVQGGVMVLNTEYFKPKNYKGE